MGLHELVEGKIDALVLRSIGHQPGYRCDRLAAGSEVGDCLICPEGTADCPEIASLRAWLRGGARQMGAFGAALRLVDRAK